MKDRPRSEYVMTVAGDTADILHRLVNDTKSDAASVIASAIRFLDWGFAQQKRGRHVGSLDPEERKMETVEVAILEFARPEPKSTGDAN